MSWRSRIAAYGAHDDPAAATANFVALVIGWNGPFYPVYLLALAGRDAGPAALLTMLATPAFLTLPLLSRRSSRAGRFGLVLVGTLNTVWCIKLLGPASGVVLFLVPCVALSALLFRRQEQAAMLAAAALPLAAYCVPSSVVGVPLMHLSHGEAARIDALNTASVLMLTALLAWQFAGLLRPANAGTGVVEDAGWRTRHDANVRPSPSEGESR